MKFIWHYMKQKDLAKWETKTICGLRTENAGLATSKWEIVNCKNCLRIQAKKTRRRTDENMDF
jgi:hypothetical protein